MGRKKITHEDFVRRVYELVGEEFLVLGLYTRMKDKIRMKHVACGHEWDILPKGFVVGNRCPKCKAKNQSKRRQKTHEQYLEEVYELVKNEFMVLGTYTSSEEKVLMKHVVCGYEYEVTPNSFLRGARCSKCAGLIKGTTESFKEKVYSLVKNEYVVLGEYINSQTKIKIQHVKCNHIYSVTPANFHSGYRCPKCSKSNPKKHEVFVNEVEELHGKEYSFLSEYVSNSHHIEVMHKKCGHIWDAIPNTFLDKRKQDKLFCPKCNNRIKITTDIMRKRIDFNLNGDFKLIGEFKTGEKSEMESISCGHVFSVDPYELLKTPKCSTCYPFGSLGEITISKILDSKNIPYRTQQTFEGCSYKSSLRFDFAILNNFGELLFLIEYDGIQHFEPTDFGGKGLESAELSFKETQIKDKIKSDYCKDNQIPLYRIPYWEIKNLNETVEKILNSHSLLENILVSN